MPPKKLPSKAVWVVSFSVIVVVVLLVLLFLSASPGEAQDSIILPAEQDNTPSDSLILPDQEEPSEDSGFFDVNNDNVLLALQSLDRAGAYHQSYTVTVGSDDIQSVQNVELWINGNYVHAEVSDDSQTKHLISDGETVYIWYNQETHVVSVMLEDGMIVEDLLGLPDLDAYLQVPQDEVVDSGYLVLEDPQVQCIYICMQNDLVDTVRYWVNLENGLLYQSDVLEESDRVYAIHQTFFETLAVEDEIFRDRFVLPDGSVPFTAARTVLQPE